MCSGLPFISDANMKCMQAAVRYGVVRPRFPQTQELKSELVCFTKGDGSTLLIATVFPFVHCHAEPNCCKVVGALPLPRHTHVPYDFKLQDQLQDTHRHVVVMPSSAARVCRAMRTMPVWVLHFGHRMAWLDFFSLACRVWSSAACFASANSWRTWDSNAASRTVCAVSACIRLWDSLHTRDTGYECKMALPLCRKLYVMRLTDAKYPSDCPRANASAHASSRRDSLGMRSAQAPRTSLSRNACCSTRRKRTRVAPSMGGCRVRPGSEWMPASADTTSIAGEVENVNCACAQYVMCKTTPPLPGFVYGESCFH